MPISAPINTAAIDADAPEPAALHTRTWPVTFPADGAGNRAISTADLIQALLRHHEPSAVWVRNGHGLLGFGEIAAHRSIGGNRFQDLSRWFSSLDISRHDAEDPSLLAFTSLSFSPDSRTESLIMIPELILRIGVDQTRLTVVSAAQIAGYAQDASGSDVVSDSEVASSPGVGADAEGFPDVEAFADAVSGPDPDLLARFGFDVELLSSTYNPATPTPVEGPLWRLQSRGTTSKSSATPQVVVREGQHSREHYLQAVSQALEHIDSGTVAKLVLARDVVVTGEEPLDIPSVLGNLTENYDQCWTYKVGTTLGATPEMLVRLRGSEIFARVLAGTLDRSIPAEQAHKQLMQDAKQRAEHHLAVSSLLDALGGLAHLQPPENPHVIELPNVYHLCSDITGTLKSSAAEPGAALLIAEKAHPTAAICGTPTEAAAALISKLEGFDRGRYSGPVGWLDIDGNADLGIALRGGSIEENGHQLRLHAGCGVVKGSVPEAELAETVSKLRPMLHALGLGRRHEL